MSEWKGDPRVFANKGFRARIRRIFEMGDPDLLLTYLLTAEQVDGEGFIDVSPTKEFFLSRLENDPELVARLRRVAEEILSEPEEPAENPLAGRRPYQPKS